MTALRMIRYRLGAWLLRPHVEPLMRHYDHVSDASVNPTGAERCTYIYIGLRYALDYQYTVEAK